METLFDDLPPYLERLSRQLATEQRERKARQALISAINIALPAGYSLDINFWGPRRLSGLLQKTDAGHTSKLTVNILQLARELGIEIPEVLQ
jgi:hypothetical protein